MERVRELYKKLGLERFSEAVYFIVCLLIFTPPGIENYSEVYTNVSKWLLLLASCAYIVIHIFKRFSKEYIKKLVKDNCIFIAMLVYFVLVNLFFSPQRIVPECAKLFIPLFCIMLLFSQENLLETKFWNTLVFYAREMLMVNFILTIIFPDGIFRTTTSSTYERANWLFGSRNNMAVLLILFFTIVYVDNLYHRKKANATLNSERNRDIFDNIFLTAVYTVYPVVMCGDDGLELFGGSSTGMIAVAFLMLLVILVEIFCATDKKWLDKLLDPRIIYVIIIVLTVGVLVGSRTEGTFSFITSIFDRSSDFTGRTVIWEKACYYISQSPIFGHGDVDIVLTYFYAYDMKVTYTYNGILELMLRYGLVGLLLFYVVLFKPFYKGHSGVLQKACSCGISALLIVGMMNTYSEFFVVALVYLADAVQKQQPLEKIEAAG